MSKVIWITGRPGTGKTTLAKEICRRYKNHILLDSDELRFAFNFKGYSKLQRFNWVHSVAWLANMLMKQGYIPVVAIVSPCKETRYGIFNDLFNKEDVTLIYLPGGHQNMWNGSTYDEPAYDEAGRYFERKYTI